MTHDGTHDNQTADDLDALIMDDGSTGDSTTDPELLRIRAEMDRLKNENTVLRESLARAQADYRNLSLRMDRDRDDMRRSSLRSVLWTVLPLADNLHRAIEHLPESFRGDTWTDGVIAIEAGVVRALSGLGCRTFESVGEVSDPARHEIILSQAGPEGIVLAEIERGYLLGDEVLRHAKVVVGSGEVQ